MAQHTDQLNLQTTLAHGTIASHKIELFALSVFNTKISFTFPNFCLMKMPNNLRMSFVCELDNIALSVVKTR